MNLESFKKIVELSDYMSPPVFNTVMKGLTKLLQGSSSKEMYGKVFRLLIDAMSKVNVIEDLEPFMVLFKQILVKWRTNDVKDQMERFVKMFTTHVEMGINDYVKNGNIADIVDRLLKVIPESIATQPYMANFYLIHAMVCERKDDADGVYKNVNSGLELLGDTDPTLKLTLASIAASTAHKEHNSLKLAVYSEILERTI